MIMVREVECPPEGMKRVDAINLAFPGADRVVMTGSGSLEDIMKPGDSWFHWDGVREVMWKILMVPFEDDHLDASFRWTPKPIEVPA